MIDFIISKIIIPLIFLFLAAMFVILCIGTYFEFKTWERCDLWETKTVWQDSYTTYIWSGNIMIPLYHPARYVDKSFCMKPKENP